MSNDDDADDILLPMINLLNLCAGHWMGFKNTATENTPHEVTWISDSDSDDNEDGVPCRGRTGMCQNWNTKENQ